MDNKYLNNIININKQKSKIDIWDKHIQIALYGCELINKTGMMLHLTEISIATAQIFFQRFYKKEENRYRFSAFFGAMTSLYLSTKVKEEKRRHRDILNIFDRILKRREAKPLQRDFQVLDPCGRRYQRWKECMMKLELIMLRELGYIFYIILPHDYLLQCIKYLEVPGITETAWGYCNDSLRLPDLALSEPKLSAIVCIFLAQKKHPNVFFPERWWKRFDVEKRHVENFTLILEDLYNIPKSRFIILKEIHPDANQPYIERIKYSLFPKNLIKKQIMFNILKKKKIPKELEKKQLQRQKYKKKYN